MRNNCCYGKRMRRMFFFCVMVGALCASLNYVRIDLLAEQHEVPKGRAVSPQLISSHTNKIQERRRRVEGVCQSTDFTGRINRVTGSKAFNISVCLVPKAGCTQWKRLIKYLGGLKNDSGDPMSIRKFEVHYHRNDLFELFHKDDAGKDFIANSVRTMNVRHPFTRLWSAYIDKLVLPDFWSAKGTEIVAMLRNNPTKRALECGHDVTFQEFVEYVVRSGHHTRYSGGDRHWLPASDLCDPCQFLPDIIQQQESLVEDFQYAMNVIGLDQLFKTMFSRDPTESEIEDEIDYVYNIFNKRTHCLTKSELPSLIWKAFILNGYIPPNVSLPTTIGPDVSKESMCNIVRDTRIKTNMTSERKRYFRARARNEAYSSLTVQQITALKDLYKMDFLFFDYSYNI